MTIAATTSGCTILRAPRSGPAVPSPGGCLSIFSSAIPPPSARTGGRSSPPLSRLPSDILEPAFEPEAAAVPTLGGQHHTIGPAIDPDRAEREGLHGCLNRNMWSPDFGARRRATKRARRRLACDDPLTGEPSVRYSH